MPVGSVGSSSPVTIQTTDGTQVSGTPVSQGSGSQGAQGCQACGGAGQAGGAQGVQDASAS